MNDASPALRALLIAASLIIIAAGLKAAATILVPLALAFFIATVSLPLLLWFRKHRVPSFLGIIVVLLIDASILMMVGWILVESATDLRAALPAYVARFQELEAAALELLRRVDPDIVAIPYAQLVHPERVVDVTTVALRGITETAAALILVLLFLIFILAEAVDFRAKIAALRTERSGDLVRFGRIVGEVQRYLAIKTIVSLATGSLIALATWLLGVDFPLLWGLLAFVLNFVPNVGSIVAAIPTVIVAFLQIGPGVALAVAACYLGVNVVLGNLVEPALVGRRLGLSTLFVLLSVVFWGWMWGPIGMLLSLPLTMAAKIVLENSPEFRWVAALMGPPVSAAGAAALAAGERDPTGTAPEPSEAAN